MTVQRLQAHYGFTRMPFGRNLAPGMLHRYTGHGEAVARISWCVDQHALGVITGEVGAGKTVAVRAATAALDNSRHVVIYLPNPSVGVRGMLHHIVSALGQVPSFYTATLAPQAADALAAAQLGARALLPKNCTLAELSIAIRNATAGGQTPHRPSLTPRQREVLELIAEGRSNKGIGERLEVSTGVVQKHVGSLFAKLGIPDSEDDHRRILAVLTFLRSLGAPAR